MDGDTFTPLIRRHAGLIHKIAYAFCRSAPDREDVVQEIAVQLWRARDRYDPTFRETTWIYRIAINVAISYFRRERRHQHAVVDVPLIAVAPVAPDERLARLLTMLDAFGPLDRALVLLYLDDNDHAAIADVLGISVSNVGTKLQRIKDKLRATASEEERHGPR